MRTVVLTVLSVLASLGAGCIGGGQEGLEAGDDAPVLEEAALPAPKFNTVDGDIQAAIATPALSFNSGGSYNHPLPTAKGEVSGWILELEWAPATRASESLDLWVRDESQGTVPPDPDDQLPPPGPVASAQGTSPLRIVLHASDLDEGTSYSVLVRAHSEPAGVAANQPFQLHTITFVDLPVDESLTAVGGSHGH